ncbi:hypothetical protein BO70DRAFT_433457 [Aspergillus heteromorphus CBS 117.55]|uniref:Uncharacterized protein n=1 Tax=Aspergillus heteromorphus CBS 117.55 TaxID=1448321 RepID=A0A317UV35_9EURO|nr:uncharacterized protein BO70DRAFT_433457 [Aspergillus heteromorphus CBS 117.55]PWY65249.1 hypothetical protein BO70DRAFT_433457 [Aspergillus heteromorphus CBS 117.55]
MSQDRVPPSNVGGKDQIPSEVLTPPEFQQIAAQKGAAEKKFMSRWDEGHGEEQGSCATEDHSFAAEKPGESDTLPGWSVMKDKLGL